MIGDKVCYFNQEFIPESESESKLKVPIDAIGGQVIFDNVRTFNGKPFKFRDHVKRLFWGCHYFGFTLDMTEEEMERSMVEVLNRNLDPAYIEKGGDYGLTMKVAGSGSFHYDDLRIHYVYVSSAYPLTPFFKSRARYWREGINLVTASSQRQVPHQCVDNRAKIPRPWYILAEREVKMMREKNPDIWPFPLILDLEGNVTETTASNFFIVKDGELHTPERNILHGISRQTVLELAKELDVPVAQRDIKLYDIYNADEAFDTRTTACIIPIQSVNGRRIGDAIPGSMTRRIVDAWSAMVGVDIVRQHMIWENEPDIRTVEG